LSPDVGLDTHIQDIVDLLVNKDLQGVILVGRRYGGMVITGAVDREPERIAWLIYLDTFAPRDGQSMASVSPVVIWLLRTRIAVSAASGMPTPTALPGNAPACRFP
jgi:pimeloyl-ACP methyl ester carboxylesterase